MTFNEFQNIDVIQQMPRSVRNNAILDAAIKIMESNNSREENYSRSNFDALTDAKKEMDAARSANKQTRSTYNLFDQIDFMENAVNGRSLKAFSVTRDTFNSLNNRAKSELSKGHEIIVEYDLTATDKDGNKLYSYETITSSYGEYNKATCLGNAVAIDANGKITTNPKEAVKIRVKHNRLANSLNNRNAVGQLITVYSSQTTAHILDSIKEGSIFNENIYTFGTFKTLIDVGIDYRTAIAFLMQPAITTINEVNNESNSIYANTGGNPINNAIKRLVARAGYKVKGDDITDFTNINDVFNLLTNDERFVNAIKELFGAEISNQMRLADMTFSLNASVLKKRLEQANLTNNSSLSKEDKVVYDLAFDIAMALTFDKIHKTTNNIEKIMRCTNPDGFGAKQTVRATRMIRNNIMEFGFNYKNPITNTIVSRNKSLIEALYPDLNSESGLDISRSVYPYLAAFIKYSVFPSIDINSKLFPTENEHFNLIIDAVQQSLGIIFTDEQYREFKQYMMSDLYSGIPYINSPITVDEHGWFIIDEDRANDAVSNDTKYWNAEKSRIFGYIEADNGNPEINNIYDPTKEELREFNKLTPAQKVLYIQNHFKDGKGIFEFITVNKFNQYEYKAKGYTHQSIRFTDSFDNMSEVYLAFNSSFYNKSPLVRLATMDLIKYAFVVEGFKFKKGGISKVITNNALYESVNNGGTNIIEAIRTNFQSYNNNMGYITDKFLNKLIRSHPEYAREIKFPKSSKINGIANITSKLNSCATNNGLIHIPYEKQYEDLIIKLLGVNPIQIEVPLEYINIKKYIGNGKYTSTLYKIEIKEYGNEIFLIPLNTLERNEVDDYSVNNNNNKYLDESYYNSVIEYSLSSDNPAEIVRNKDGKYTEHFQNKEDSVIPKFKFHQVVDSLNNIDKFINVATGVRNKDQGAVNAFFEQVNEFIELKNDAKGNSTLVWSNSDFIRNQIPIGAKVIQNILIGDDIVPFIIKRAKTPKGFNDSISKRQRLSNVSIKNSIAYKRAYDSTVTGGNYYEVTRVTDNETRKNTEDIINEIEENRKPDMAAITSDATNIYIEEANRFEIVDETSKDLIIALKRAERNGDKNAERAIRALEIKGINAGRSKDIADNRKNIYSIYANYMEIAATIFEKTISNYEIDGKVYNIGDNELYTALREHPEHVETIVKLLLEAVTFGQNLGNIMSLPLEGLDAETTAAIKRIRNAINRIRHNPIIKAGFDNMFNNYIANEYSTNPNVRLGIVNLKDTFGDSGWWEHWIGDINAISNKEIQTIVKIVNNIMIQASREDAPRRKREFLKRFDSIMDKAGEFNWNNVIDEQGRLIRPYTYQFIEDRQRLIDAVKTARDTYGEDSIEFVKAKLKRDKWYAKNVHQIVVPEYYNRKNAFIENIIRYAPDEYVEYMKYVHELYGDTRPSGTLTIEERNRRKEINKKINRLTSDFREDGTEKTYAEKERAEKLRAFIAAKRNLDKEYFNWDESFGFREALEANLTIIEKYKTEYPNKTLDERLKDANYRMAYEWVQDNSYYIIDDETQKAINNAFNILKDKDNVNNDFIREILNRANAYDAFGNIDPRKLSDKDIAEIKEATEHKYNYSYDSNAGEAILIKDIPSGLPIFKDSFYRLLRDPSENEKEVNPRRLAIIAEINKLLSKVVSKNGRIHAKDLFEKLTEEEVNELANLYRGLKGIKGKRKTKELRKKFKDNVEFKTYDEAFNEELSWALSNLKGTANFDVFLSIFAQTDSSGILQLNEKGEYQANTDIYGYIEPKDDKYIDKEKTEARKLIEENVEFVSTEYYYAALKEATKKGEFAEWYRKNHVYNPYKHRFEPLRVWTTMKINPNGSLKGTYSYVPTYENTEKNVKDKYVNPNYKKYNTNYNTETGDYNQSNSVSSKEKEMQELLSEAMDFFAKYNPNNSFVEQGFVPRRRNVTPDTKWVIKEALGAVGLEWRNDSEDKWYDKIDYANDRDVENKYLTMLKGKGYQEYEKIRPKGITETDEQYQEYLEAVKQRNKEVRQHNLEIDNALMDKDWRSVFAEAIREQVIANAKTKSKYWVYLLQEDLKQNPAYATSTLTGKVRVDKRRSTDTRDRYVTTPQNRALDMVESFARRVIYDQFKQRTKWNKYADLARNITSAKYMIFNLTGGIANIGTGFANMMGEYFAGDNFSKEDFRDGVKTYLLNSISMISDMYSDTSNNFYVALTKYFKVVDTNSMLERVNGESAGEYARRIKDLLYSMQSGGEHFMQNSILFTVLKSYRVYDDIDGTKRAGGFQQYIWKLEYDTFVSIISKDPDLADTLKVFKQQIKLDRQEQQRYDTFKTNIIEEFLRSYCTKEQIEEYITKKNEAIKEAREKFDTLPRVIDQLELGEDAVIYIKEGSELTQDMINQITNTVINLNKKIHGVYDKIGAARIEFAWWGGLVMQYHKHIYPGIMKRFRTKAYYNEQTETVEIGSYAALVRLLGREFIGIKQRIKNRSENEQIEAVNSVIEVAKTALDCILNIRTNWGLMPKWEQNAVKRCLGDLYGITSALIMSIAIYAMTDDDDEKESEIIATALYISDRLLSESQMYTPWGLIGEARTMWSSPIAATNGPIDLLKCLSFAAQWMFDEDFDPNYKTGLYAGENKIWVRVRRNIPIYRVYDRLKHMTENNSYYRINEKSINMSISKAIADYVNPD